jgi:activator of HSP90 ATPase
MPTDKTVRTATIHQRVTIPASPEAVYDALTNARLHAAFTGAAATGRARVGYRFTAWDGYIEGTHLALEPGRLMVQEWSTPEWPKACPPSRLQFRLKQAKAGTELTMIQSGVPASQSRGLRSGWAEYYWQPLRAWFANKD